MLATIILALTLGASAAPTTTKVTIHPNGKCSECITGRGTTEFTMMISSSPCNYDAPGSFWQMATSGPTLIQTELNGKKWCLYGGDAPGGHTPNQPAWSTMDGALVRLMACDNVAWPTASSAPTGFNWNVQGKSLRITGLSPAVCLDRTMMDEILVIDGNHPMQLYTCFNNNGNQEWTVNKWS